VKAINNKIVWSAVCFLRLNLVEQDEKRGKNGHNNQVGDGGNVISQVSFFSVYLIWALFSFVQLNSKSDKDVASDAEKLQNRDSVVRLRRDCSKAGWVILPSAD
jgi:hypothetical protein